MITLLATQGYDEALEIATQLKKGGVEVRIDSVEIKSSYSNYVTWFQLNIEDQYEERANQILAEKHDIESSVFVDPHDKHRGKRIGTRNVIIGALLCVAGIGTWVLSMSSTSPFQFFWYGSIIIGIPMIVRGFIQIRNHEKGMF